MPFEPHRPAILKFVSSSETVPAQINATVTKVSEILFWGFTKLLVITLTLLPLVLQFNHSRYNAN